MERKRIGLDLDGVLYPFSTICFDIIKEKHNYNFDEIEFWSRTYRSNRFKGKHREEVDAIVSDPNTYIVQMMHPNDVLVLMNLKAMGNELFYITARGNHLQPVTDLWLRASGAPFVDNLYVGYDEKTPLIKLLNLDVYVDDRAGIVQDASAVTDAYLFHAPYLTGENLLDSGLPYLSKLNSLLLLE